MQKHRIRFNSEDDVRSQKSHYTNVSRIDSKHVELCLEVEVDDEVRNIIKHPEKCPSTLLDVTVIKPKGLDQYTTNTQILKTDQVKKMLESVKLDNTNKKKLMEKIFGRNYATEPGKRKQADPKPPTKYGKRKSCLSAKSKHIYKQSSLTMEQGDVHCITDETNSAVFTMYNQRAQPKVQQIYTTPKTFENIRAMFACKNKQLGGNETDKSDQPCLCQNCAIVGILTDSQKKPFATEPMPDPTEEIRESRFRRPSRKKSVSFKPLESLPSAARSHDQCQAIFKLLSARISELEKRVLMQEEKAVPKDYFKKIITKLVNHLSKLTHYTTEERNLGTSHRQKDLLPPYGKYKSNDKYNRYYVNHLLLDNNFKFPAEKEFDPRPCSSADPPHGPTDSIWKWGEEFLSSGRDLKNRVVILLEETLRNLKKGWEQSQNHSRCDEEVQSVVDELSKNLAQTIKMTLPTPKNAKAQTAQAGKPRTEFVCVSTGVTTKPKEGSAKKSGKPSLIPRFKRNNVPAVNVAYINPQLTRWPEESSVSFKIETSDYDSHIENMNESKRKQYKKEFLKVLENTRTTDKFKLWQNIWNQALENRQTKNDVVTIQIPDPKDALRQKMIQLEYTIGELEQLLIQNHHHHHHQDAKI